VRRGALDAVLDCLGELGVPILAGLPVGHGARNQPLPLGVPALLDASLGSLVVNPDARDLTRPGPSIGSRA
jgi:muramoyltetrapeptide carboxypeptidase